MFDFYLVTLLHTRKVPLICLLLLTERINHRRVTLKKEDVTECKCVSGFGV